MLKQWDSTLDGSTRETHQALDGQIRETDEPFEVNGKKAMYPGGFGDPAEDCNCRCVALTRARWGLDDKELETLKERAKFYGLDKKDSFEAYRGKYLKAAESVEKTGKSGIIVSRESEFTKAFQNGEVSTRISPQKQRRHIRGTHEYERHVNDMSKRNDVPSYILDGLTFDDLKRIVISKLTGQAIMKNDKSFREYVMCDEVIGCYYDKAIGGYVETRCVQVDYALGDKNIHIVPIKELKVK